MPSIDKNNGVSATQLGTLNALVERMYPSTDWGPGASELNVASDIIAHLGGPFGTGEDSYAGLPFVPDADPAMGWQTRRSRRDALLDGLDMLQHWSTNVDGLAFDRLPAETQDELIKQLEQGKFPGFEGKEAQDFFSLVLDEVFTALFVTPALGEYGLASAWKRLLRSAQAESDLSMRASKARNAPADSGDRHAE
ncbi:gluconate 2-dehydrogenase subunit 3 family protein [Caballeronia sp. dw_19]|uniref:gluconate 2-dehydrogenase subunit 3 family protein n=1 Tax=Caballeronia sp. dw_19 TaxID=2719791 RepID=UPI001BD6696A|nr:gluconate 2-dehydrogenase subunit 3 family protein [Caballeronia sp. dw_19]